ncbi:MAG: tRNA lysidine(34) synthetase TilS, partial [Ktedonobacterales bacterium]|nr:tRNA lysidine(34) synthetase TilS [Ktedonobacterales bacterium]
MLLRSFERKVRQACVAEGLLPSTGGVVVACSGGADSLALLLALHALCGRAGAAFPAVRLHAAHLDHGLRG